MTREEYETLMRQVAAVGAMVREWDLQKALDMIGQADAFGLMLDPTAWIRGHKPMHDYERLLRGLLPFQKVVHELAAEAQL